jgi:competence protein ComEC
MRDLSLTHLVAVSGANLAIVVGAVWFLLAALGLNRHLRFLIGLLAMVAYVLLVGPESSVIRAATMALFVTLALWLGRGSSPLHALAAAVSLILIVDPGMAVDFGFSLSALATAGLLIAAAPLFESLRTRLPDWLALGVAAAFSAQLFTTPILLMLQPGIPLYAVLANLLVEPVVAPVTILGILSAAMSLPVPLISTLLANTAGLGTSWIVLVASHLSQLPLVRLHFVGAPVGVILASLVVILTAGFFRATSSIARRATLFGIASVALFGTVLSALDVARAKVSISGWEILNCDIGQGDALLVKSSNRVALVDVGPDPELLSSCLSDAGVSKLDLLIISHYDSDHVAGISALSQTSISLAVLPGFDDERPLVTEVANVLASSAKKVVTGQKGMMGELGDCSWEILEPSFTASEASDSNDASLVSFFDCASYSLLGLGDLGESGQERLLTSSQLKLASSKPLVLKVAHHGSADQSRSLHEFLQPEIALISVGANRFGHPTDRVLRILNSVGAATYRTDLQGAIAIQARGMRLQVKPLGKLAS